MSARAAAARAAAGGSVEDKIATGMKSKLPGHKRKVCGAGKTFSGTSCARARCALVAVNAIAF